MKIISKISLLIFACVILQSCGYSIAGLGKGEVPRYYVENIKNDTLDPAFSKLFQREIEEYLMNYGELATYKNSNYIMMLNLKSIQYDAAVVTDTDEAVSTDAKIELEIVIMDKTGITVFSKSFEQLQSMSVTATISGTLKARNIAMRSAIETIMDSFRNSFNARFYR